MNGKTAAQFVGEYAAAKRFDELSELTITRARQVLLDHFGVTLGGIQTGLGRLAVDYAARMHPGDAATIIGDGRRSTLEGAAWANAVTGKAMGMDDSHRTAGHVAAELAPVVLAIGELYQLTGRQLITALAVGYDVMDMIHSAVDAWQRERGMDHKGQAGTMASAVAAAVAMGLSADQITHALALAMDMACGTEQYVYDAGACDTKDLLAAYAAQNGIASARMAEYGFRGPPGALDGEYGYFHAFGPGYDPAFLDRLDSQALARTGFKPHAGCRHVHSCVDATQTLLQASQPNLEAITGIEIDTYHEAITPSFRVNYAPETLGQASFSLPVTVSVILTRGHWFSEDIATYDEPEQRRLRQLVTVGLDEAIQAEHPLKNGCEVRIHTADGQLHRGRVEHAKGEPENMLTEAEFAAKFHHMAGDILPAAQSDELLDSIARLETLDDVGHLVRLSLPEAMPALAAV